MAGIVSPQPRTAGPSPALSASRLLKSPINLPDAMDSPSRKRGLFSPPPRLRSPIDLFDPRANKADPSCAPVKKRRGFVLHRVRTPRRRHCSRPDCPSISTGGPISFDNLPWISQLEESPTRVSIYDAGDLSVLTTDVAKGRSEPPHDGAVRKRKPSRPSHPAVSMSNENIPIYRPQPHHSDLPPAYSLIHPDRFPASPRTPPPRESFVPSQVQFHGLRPAFPPGLDD